LPAAALSHERGHALIDAEHGSLVADHENLLSRDDTPRKINISMPEWMIDELDAAARHLAVPRQAVINMWIADRLKSESNARA
jgi:hypothetical protein